jgi:hypothetical protein
MEDLNGCQIPNLRNIAEGKADFEPQPFIIRFKRMFARPWNYFVKKNLKKALMSFTRLYKKIIRRKEDPHVIGEKPVVVRLQVGDLVRVRTYEEIKETLDRFKELKGCAFLEDMKQYCGTQQRVFKVMERFLDERDYQVKRVKGIVLLEGVYCQGTPVFGRCDRSCLSFWREEWLEKIS